MYELDVVIVVPRSARRRLQSRLRDRTADPLSLRELRSDQHRARRALAHSAPHRRR